MRTLGRAGAWALAGLCMGASVAALAADASKAVSYEFVPVQLGDEVKGAVPARAHTSATPSIAAPPYLPLGQGYAAEVEPNGTTALATPLAGTNLVVRGNLFPNGDIDFYSFTANAGDRIYAATMTSFSAGSSTDSQLRVIASDGTTVIEFDDDNGSFAALSSSIAGATIPTTGTYFLQVNDFTAGTTSERPYELHFRIQSGAPTPEVEPNDTPATANVLPANGWVSGTRSPAAATEQDWYSLTLNAGDTVYLALDLDPERDGVVWNGRLGFALFGDAANQILVVDDAGAAETPTTIPSEAMFFTVKEAGTYFAFVDSASAAVGGPTATYHLSVSVHPAANEGVNCTTYTSTNVPVTIGPGTGSFTSTITVPGNPRIADLDVTIDLSHALMQDIDAQLIAPNLTSNGLFTDIGAAATGGQQQMSTTFDDEAGIPPTFTALRGTRIKPELAYRLSWFDGMDAGGTWTLQLFDDTAGANGGTLTGWSMRICEVPPPPSCAPGFAPTTVYSTDFEANAGGFTSSGTANEWERGLPATLATSAANPVAAFNSCNSGVSCFKTDLDNTYDVSSNQDLLSPNINLAGLSPPVLVSWAHRYQMESANFDHYHVDFRQVGGGTSLRLFEWLDATMTNAPGNPVVQTPAAAGWGVRTVRADALAGLNTELLFHLDSDTTVNFGGVAVDDVTVTACRALSADLSITKTNGVTSSVPGGSTTYTITASNAGSDPVTGATVADTFPAVLTCNWSCSAAGGGSCTASGSGNISDTVNLPVGGSVTYTASCTINPAATGNLSNTATVSSTVTDPAPGNNSATDTDTLTPQADLSITKTDGVTSAVPGGSTTYTIVASNAGPSNAPGSTVADTFPATCSAVNWTCSGAGGGSCTASGSGNISDAVNLPAGGSVTYSASCAISPAATGNLVNTATVAVAAGISDGTPGNNSATDTNTLTPQADLSITKTDGVATVTSGGSTTYTIVASNAGPSSAPGSTVADAFPASCTAVSWTCTGAGGGSCTASGSGNISDTVNLPTGGSVTYTASCTISPSATGTLSNTATVAAGAGISDGTPGNNSSTDTSTVVVPGMLTVAPASFDFGSVAIGITSPATTITLGNSGGSPLSVTTLTAATSPFALTGGSCGAVPIAIPNGGSCTLTYTFTPVAAGAVSQNFAVDAGADGAGNFSLSGTGGQGVVGVLDASLNFGDQSVGASNQRVLTITNTGSGPITVTALTAVTAPFSQIAGGSCGALPFTLAAGESCTVLYRFSPAVAGPYTQVITVSADVGTVAVSLSGRGILVIALPLGGMSSLILLGLFIAGALVVLRRRG